MIVFAALGLVLGSVVGIATWVISGGYESSLGFALLSIAGLVVGIVASFAKPAVHTRV